jgi:hypothetical protein
MEPLAFDENINTLYKFKVAMPNEDIPSGVH